MYTELVHNVECQSCTEVSQNSAVKPLKRSFEKKSKIGRLPECLVLHIQRTMWLLDGSITKNPAHLSFPMTLDMSHHLLHTDDRYVYW